jgi:drug/metabolite transporter (DMT)-like permease
MLCRMGANVAFFLTLRGSASVRREIFKDIFRKYQGRFLTELIFSVITVAALSGHLPLALAMQEGDISTVVPLLGLKIPFTAILAFFFLGEVYPTIVYAAVAVAAIAAALFGIGRQAKAQGGHGTHTVVGVLLAASSALMYSIGDIFVKKSLGYIEPLQSILWVMAGSNTRDRLLKGDTA